MKRKWNNENLGYAKKLIDQGYTRKDVAKKMGVSANALYMALHKWELSKKQLNKKELRTSDLDELFEKGESPYSIKNKTGLSLQTIRETAANMGIVNY